ncbi:MAG: hypothetical protein ACREID_03365, partial [Planctomycetota bacterium]
LKVITAFQSPEHAVNVDAKWRALGMDAVDAFAFAEIPSGADFRTEIAFLLREKRGFFGLFSEGEPDRRFASRVPAGALLYGSEHADLGVWFPRYWALLAELGEPGQFPADGPAGLDAWFGVDLRRELLPAVGPEWAGYVGAPPAGGLIPDVALFVSIRDRAVLEKFLSALTARLRADGGDLLVAAGETEFRGHRIRFLELTERNGDPFPITPAWTIGEDWAAFGLFPQTLKGALAEKASIETNADYQALRRSIPSSTVSSTYVDLRKLVGWSYNTVVPVLQVVQGRINRDAAKLGFRLNFEDLPPADVFLRHVSGAMFYTAPEPDCLRMGFVSPFGSATVTVPVFVLGMMAVGLARGERMEVDVEPGRDEVISRQQREIEELRRRLEDAEER